MPFCLFTEEVKEIINSTISYFESTNSYSFPPSDEFKTENLLKDERKGLMFSILVAKTKENKKVILRGFSGLAEGRHKVPGYVNPTYSVNEFLELEKESDKAVKDPTIDSTERRKRSKYYAKKFEELHVFRDIDNNEFRLSDLKEGGGFCQGTGDCAGIKVLNSAMRKGYQIMGFGEFYFGPDKSGMTKGTLVPPCKERCELIIKRMLKLDFIYLDEDIAIINKPSGLLSAPGKGPDKLDSASERLKKIFPFVPVSPFVHRLDMDTSGLLILALNKEAHRTLSMAFERREVKKEYEALLVGKLDNNSGIIDAPMRLDVDNRPYQIIDYKDGKKALTEYEVLDIEWKNGVLCSRVRFKPLTGRTHQLRVHSAFIGHPILSDRLYGEYIENTRLALHASKIAFTHPRTKEEMVIESKPPF